MSAAGLGGVVRVAGGVAIQGGDFRPGAAINLPLKDEGIGIVFRISALVGNLDDPAR